MNLCLMHLSYNVMMKELLLNFCIYVFIFYYYEYASDRE